MIRRISLQNIRLVVALLFAMLSLQAHAQFEIPEKPIEAIQRTTRVYDYIDLLQEAEFDNLNSKLLRYDDSTSTQIVVAIIESTQGEDISLLGAQWGEKWGIGREGQDNGIFITLAYGDRTVDINTGYGIEGILTDRMAEKVINQRMIPEFKLGSYYLGLNRGVDGIIEVLKGEFQEQQEFNYESDEFPVQTIVIIVSIFMFIVIILGLGLGAKGGSTGSLHDTITYSNSGRSTGSWGSSGSSWSSGSSSSSSFGGGSFGGGGASGSW